MSCGVGTQTRYRNENCHADLETWDLNCRPTRITLRTDSYGFPRVSGRALCMFLHFAILESSMSCLQLQLFLFWCTTPTRKSTKSWSKMKICKKQSDHDLLVELAKYEVLGVPKFSVRDLASTKCVNTIIWAWLWSRCKGIEQDLRRFAYGKAEIFVLSLEFFKT